MKRILMTTALVAMMPMAVLAQSAETSADADAAVKLKTQQMEQSADATGGADAALSEDGTNATMAAEADGAMVKPDAGEEQTAEGTDPMMPKAEESESIADAAADVNGTAMTGETMQTADMTGMDLGITGEASASSIIGSRVYVIRGDDAVWDRTATYDAVDQNWERAGSVQDIVIGANGQVEGIVAEVGGFLGIGDKFVLLNLGEAKLIPLEGGGFDVVTHYTNEELTDMQSYETASLQ